MTGGYGWILAHAEGTPQFHQLYLTVRIDLVAYIDYCDNWLFVNPLLNQLFTELQTRLLSSGQYVCLEYELSQIFAAMEPALRYVLCRENVTVTVVEDISSNGFLDISNLLIYVCSLSRKECN